MKGPRLVTGRCPTYRCGSTLHASTDGNGRTIWTCTPCERVAAGFCIDCPSRLVIRVGPRGPGRPRRCPGCAARAATNREKARSKRPERKKEVLAFIRRYRKTEKGRAATNAASRKYREKNPYTDLDRKIRRIRAQQRRERRQQVAA